MKLLPTSCEFKVASLYVMPSTICPLQHPSIFGSGNQEENQTTLLLEPNELQMHMRRYNYRTIALISHASKIMLKILQAKLQQYVNQELPDVQAGFRKAEEPEIKLPTYTRS